MSTIQRPRGRMMACGLTLLLALTGVAGAAQAGEGSASTPAGLHASAAARFVVLDQHNDPTNDGAKDGEPNPVPMDPELVWSGMAFRADDPAVAGDEAATLLVEGRTSGATDGTDSAGVALDVNGDSEVDYMTLTPEGTMAADTGYTTPIVKVVGDNVSDTGQSATWVRSDSDAFHGYDAWFNWKKLGLAKVRYSFLLEDATEVYDTAPDDFTGALISLPRPPAAPSRVKATAGLYRATVSWARPASAYTVRDYKVTAYDAKGRTVGRTCTVKAPALACTVTGLKTATLYRFRVVARSDAGTSARSAYTNYVVPLPKVKITLKAVYSGSRLFVDVDPNLSGTRYWTFRVQKRVNRTWVYANTVRYTTQTSKETRTIDLRRGTYRIMVYAAYGYSRTYSPTSVYLSR